MGGPSMNGVFEVGRLRDVPEPGRSVSILTARVDLDIATEKAALEQVREVVSGTGDAMVVDLGGVFVGACGVGLVVTAVERAARARKPCAVVSAPQWMIHVAARLDVPPISFHDSLSSAVASLCMLGTAGHRDGEEFRAT
jgi:anti-anti-sigma regulatory factor